MSVIDVFYKGLNDVLRSSRQTRGSAALPGQPLPTYKSALVYFVAAGLVRWYQHVCVRAADSSSVSTEPKLPFPICL